MGSDLTRVIVTIVSIAGCCILLMVGFTLKFGEDRIVQRQYGEVMTFEYKATANNVKVKVEASKDGGAFTEIKNTGWIDKMDDFATYTIDGLAAGNYQFRFGFSSRDIKATATAKVGQYTEKVSNALAPKEKLKLLQQ